LKYPAKIPNNAGLFLNFAKIKKKKMEKDAFIALLPLKVQSILRVLLEQGSLSFREALQYVYSSEIYHLLEQEETKVWHFSPHMLVDLIEREKRNGYVELPDYV
jgi:hypothetical protein